MSLLTIASFVSIVVLMETKRFSFLRIIQIFLQLLLQPQTMAQAFHGCWLYILLHLGLVLFTKCLYKWLIITDDNDMAALAWASNNNSKYLMAYEYRKRERPLSGNTRNETKHMNQKRQQQQKNYSIFFCFCVDDSCVAVCPNHTSIHPSIYPPVNGLMFKE